MLSKVAGFPIQDTAVGFYRVVQPLRFLKREGLAKEAKMTPFNGDGSNNNAKYNDKMYTEVAKGADVLITTLVMDPDLILKIMNIKHHFKLKWVVDIDDNLFAVHFDNPARQHAIQNKDKIGLCLELADGIIASVPTLKNVYKDYNKNIFVGYNGLDMKLWMKSYKKPKKHKGIRIGWEGAWGHKNDLELAIPSLKALQNEYDITFVTLGYKPEGIKTEHHEWVSFMDYPQKLNELNLDIVIAPLVDSSYNRCKSNLRLLEGAALKKPLVYSDTVNYRGFPGLVSSNNYEWYENLEKLIKDKDLREKLGKEAFNYLNDNFSMKKLVHPLAEWLEKLPYKEHEPN